MPISKQSIIDNIEQYTAPELVDYIRSGIITFDELCEDTEGYLPASVRKEVKRLLTGTEEEDWIKARSANMIENYMSFLKLYPESCHADEARNNIRRLQQASITQEKAGMWDATDKSSITELQKFISENPGDPRCIEARKLINTLQKERFLGFDEKSFVERINALQTDRTVTDPDAAIFEVISRHLDERTFSSDTLLEIIRKDNNVLSSNVLKKLIENGYITYLELSNIGIDERFIQHLARGEEKQRFERPHPLTKINKVCTEIYFWGIPSSGKSCALGAIMSVAGNGTIAKSMTKNPDCQGYGYMMRLSNLFKSDGKVTTLPEGTSIFSTYEMGFDLEDEKGAMHPITFIDLAGELVRCMYKSDAGEELTEDEKNSLDTLTNILVDNRSTNRKIHFFVLEYGAENRKFEGLSQNEYLEAALRYIERTKIFVTDTDAIYLMITKVDKTGKVGPPMIDILERYLTDNYRGFFNGLERICRDNDINKGRVERIPFSLGKVCFQDYCLFNGAAAANVVKKIINRTKGFKTGFFDRGLNIFRP